METEAATPTLVLERRDVFVNREWRYRKVTLEISPELIRVINNGREVQTYEIVEVVKDGMAWDVVHRDGRQRFVAQEKCGCSGMKRYVPDDGYSGALTVTGRPATPA